jgi:hypothetical protein
VWFNHAVLISSRNNEVPFQITVREKSETGKYIVVETKRELRDDLRAELLRIPLTFAHLIEVSR